MGGPPDPLPSSAHIESCHSKHDSSSSSKFDLNFDKDAFENHIKNATSHLKHDFSQIKTSFEPSSFEHEETPTSFNSISELECSFPFIKWGDDEEWQDDEVASSIETRGISYSSEEIAQHDDSETSSHESSDLDLHASEPSNAIASYLLESCFSLDSEPSDADSFAVPPPIEGRYEIKCSQDYSAANNHNSQFVST